MEKYHPGRANIPCFKQFFNIFWTEPGCFNYSIKSYTAALIGLEYPLTVDTWPFMVKKEAGSQSEQGRLPPRSKGKPNQSSFLDVPMSPLSSARLSVAVLMMSGVVCFQIDPEIWWLISMELYSFPMKINGKIYGEIVSGFRFRWSQPDLWISWRTMGQRYGMVPAGTSAGGFWENLRRPSMLSTSLSSGVCPAPVAVYD